MCHTFLFRCWWARFFRMMRDGQHWWVQPPYALTTVAVIWTSLSSPSPSSLPNFMQSPVLLHIQRRPSTYIDIDSCLWRRICVHFNCKYGQVILTVPSGSGKTNTVCVAAFKLCCLSEGLATQGICNCFFGGGVFVWSLGLTPAPWDTPDLAPRHAPAFVWTKNNGGWLTEVFCIYPPSMSCIKKSPIWVVCNQTSQNVCLVLKISRASCWVVLPYMAIVSGDMTKQSILAKAPEGLPQIPLLGEGCIHLPANLVSQLGMCVGIEQVSKATSCKCC